MSVAGGTMNITDTSLIHTSNFPNKLGFYLVFHNQNIYKIVADFAQDHKSSYFLRSDC